MDKLNKSLEFLKLLSTTASKILIINVETLFTTCDENDYNVRLTVEENLNKFNLKEAVLTRIQVELHRIIKHNPNVEPNALKDQLLGYSDLFDFDQLLISTQIGSIEKTCVSEVLKTSYSTYQR
ncbi:unnamed protein product [Rotaria sp. Silwood1]|nr:unnamed protein product [Rotaria sp. Silwood1]CAF1652711.1 unnamed protein product [Rotaria sp. Silwood1]